MASLVDRMVRAAKLDINLYEEVEADKGSMGQAITVVVLSSVAGGIGSIGVLGISGLIFGTIFLLSIIIGNYCFFQHMALYKKALRSLTGRSQDVANYQVGFLNYGSLGCVMKAKNL